MQTRLCHIVSMGASVGGHVAVPLVFDEETGKICVAEHELIYPMDYLLPPTYKLKKESNIFIYVKCENNMESDHGISVIVEYGGGEPQSWCLNYADVLDCALLGNFFSIMENHSGYYMDICDGEMFRHSSSINHRETFMTETYCDHCGKWILDVNAPPALRVTTEVTATTTTTEGSCSHV